MRGKKETAHWEGEGGCCHLHLSVDVRASVERLYVCRRLF